MRLPDEVALYFFTTLKSCLEREARSARYIVSGHDIERWLLKTIKALAASKNPSRNRERLSGAFSGDVEALDMLDDPTRWPDGAGLYCVMNAGDVTENHNRFQLQAYTNQHGEISGLGVNARPIQRIHLAAMASGALINGASRQVTVSRSKRDHASC
jgi:hypothetical protein